MNWWALSFAIAFIVLLLFVSITMFWTVKWPNWRDGPYNALPNVIDVLGRPSSADFTANGMAVWDANDLSNQPWTRVILRDEAIPCCCPTPHDTFLYATICVDIPDALMESMVLSISDSMWYDSVKNRLWFRSNSLRGITAMAMMATDLLLLRTSTGTKFGDVQQMYDYYWNNSDKIAEVFSDLYTAVTATNDDQFSGLLGELNAALDVLGCPAPDECSGPNCTTNWSGKSVAAALDSTGVKSIPPSSDDSNSKETFMASDDSVCGTEQCSPRNHTGSMYDLAPTVAKSCTAEDVRQPYTLGYPVNDSLPFNALSLTRERFTPEILADTRQRVDGKKVGIARSTNALNGRKTNMLALARHERTGPLHHPAIDYSLALHNTGKDVVEGWASEMTNGQCKTCNVKRNGRPMTISAV